jgi:AsmA protein
MKRLLKLLLGLIGLLFVVLAALVIVLTTMDPNEHKDWISDQFHARTGRTLTLKGNLGLTFYPWLGVEANDATISNAAGFGKAPFLHVGHANLRIKLLPLLQDRYVVDTVQVDDLVLNLEMNKEGRSNWADLVSPQPKTESAGLPLAAIALGGVQIKNAAVHWDNHATGVRYDITRIQATTGPLVYGKPVKLDLSLQARANRPALAADLALSGTLNYDQSGQQYTITPLQLSSVVRGHNIPGGQADIKLGANVKVDLDKDTASLSDIKLDALKTRATGMLQASRISSPRPSLRASLDVTGEDLSLPFRVLEIEPLASQLARLKERGFKLSTRLDADMQRGDVDVPAFSAKLLGADIKAEVKATNIQSDTPAAKGNITAGGPDLPTLMQVLGQFQGGKDKTLVQYGRKLGRVGDKAFSVKAVFDADMKRGDVNVPTLSMDSLGIHVAGNLKAKDMLDSDGTIEGSLKLTSDRIAGVLAALDNKDLAEVVKAVDLQTGISGNRSDLSLKPLALKISLNKQKLELNAASRINLDKQQLDLPDFSLTGLGLNIKGRFNADKISTAPAYEGHIKVAPFNLNTLMRELNKKPPVTAGKTALNRVAADVAFSGTRNDINISKLDLGLDKSTLKGSLAVKDLAKPAIDAKLAVDQINLDDYLPPAAKNKPVTPEAAAGAATTLPVKTLRALDARVDVKAGRLVISGLRLADVQAHLDGKNGLIKLDPIAAALYQGHYAGNMRIDATGKLPKLTIDSTLKGVQMEPLLKDFTGKPAQLHGTSNLTLALTTSGRTTDAMKKALNGKIGLDVDKGVLMGVDVRKVLAQAEIMLESKQLTKVERGEKTEFDKLSANLVIKSGIVDNHDMVMRSPGFIVTGDGMLANLHNDSIKYNMKVAVEKARAARGQEEYNLGGYTIPIECRGKYQSPDCRPDYDVLIKAGVKKAAEDKLKDVLKGLFKK